MDPKPGPLLGAHGLAGIEGRYTDAQIIAALRTFYQEWKPPADQPGAEPPSVIVAAFNWGTAAGLYDPLKKLCQDLPIDVWFWHPTEAGSNSYAAGKQHPTENDRKLAEILKRKVQK